MTDWVIGVDVGGTFTDFSARNKNDHNIQVHKRPSTPNDPSRAILEGLRELLDIADIDGAKFLELPMVQRLQQMLYCKGEVQRSAW